MRRVFLSLTLAASCVGLLPAVVFAQGGISGVVRDTSGAVLPGVTVEATSPALIERVRTATTDEKGQYSMVSLRPGTYAVTFMLTGFAAVKREGLELSAGVTLPLNAELKVGAIAETVTVSGTTPVVDIQSTKVEAVLNRELLDAIPHTRQQGWAGSLLPGVSVVGGATPIGMGGGASGSTINLAIHGSDGNDQSLALDGMKITEGSTSRRLLLTADAAVQEYTYQTSGQPAEIQGGGVWQNLVPKEGGNRFTGNFFVAGTAPGMTKVNVLSPTLQALGALYSDNVRDIWDISPALGGPIVRDKLWFFESYRHNGRFVDPVGAFYLYDPTREATLKSWQWDENTRLTWQITPRNKVSGYCELGNLLTPDVGLSNLRPVETTTGYSMPGMYLCQGRWNAPLTSRLLIEAGAYKYYQFQYFGLNENSLFSPANGPTPADPRAWPAQEIATGQFIGGTASDQHRGIANWIGTSAAVSYVTGSHYVKVGFTHVQGSWATVTPEGLPVLRFNNGVPFQVQLSARPVESYPRANHDLGAYAQDRWTIRRLTVNYGLRFDAFNGQVDEQNLPAAYWLVPARHLDLIADVPSWKDISPRLGVAYDVFGNGKTAVKTSLSRYVAFEAHAFADAANPLASGGGGGTDTRLWMDRNGDRIAQLDELGPSTNLNFGLPVLSTRYDDDVRLGFSKRGYNWEYAASVQQELRPGWALNAGYYRRWFGNLRWTNNTLVSPTEFTEFTFVSPLDGSRITSYNLSVAKRGQSYNVIMSATDNTQVFDGVDVTVSGRFGKGGIVNGGITMGRTVTDSCSAYFDPNSLRFCAVTPDLMKLNQYKAVAAYPLPYDLRVSGAFISTPGPQVSANYTVTSAIAGVPLTNGSLVVNLVEPGTLYGDRLNRLDLRVMRTFRARSTRVEPYIEILNLLNTSPALNQNNTYGPSWQVPSSIQPGRMVQLGVQVNF
jgi:hypothetical protein